MRTLYNICVLLAVTALTAWGTLDPAAVVALRFAVFIHWTLLALVAFVAACALALPLLGGEPPEATPAPRWQRAAAVALAVARCGLFVAAGLLWTGGAVAATFVLAEFVNRASRPPAADPAA